jgi:hypothetical protein
MKLMFKSDNNSNANIPTKSKMFSSLNIYANPSFLHSSSPYFSVAFFVPCRRTPLSALDPPLSFYGYVNSDLKSDFRSAEQAEKKIAEPSL